MYSNLLEHYVTNSARTNHYILSFMMRLSNFTVSVGCLVGAWAYIPSEKRVDVFACYVVKSYSIWGADTEPTTICQKLARGFAAALSRQARRASTLPVVVERSVRRQKMSTLRAAMHENYFLKREGRK